MLLHEQWVKTELTEPEQCMLYNIIQHKSSFKFDSIESLTWSKLHLLPQKINDIQNLLTEEGIEVLKTLVEKLKNLTDLQ